MPQGGGVVCFHEDMAIFRRKDDVDVQSFLENLDRLDALASTGLMDAPPKDELDRLTEAAADTLGTPIALLSLVDDRRQFFASDVGFVGYLSESRQTSLDYSYCKHVVAQEDVFAVENSVTDPAVKDNKATTELGLRSYLGVPLRKNGFVLGSFCVVDVGPRSWSDEDVAALRDLAAKAAAEL